MVRSYAVILGLAIVSCQVGPLPQPVTPVECEPTVIPSPDPTRPDTVIPGVCEDCQSACKRGRELGCTAADDRCLPACQNAEDQGTLRRVDVKCLTWAKDCREWDGC